MPAPTLNTMLDQIGQTQTPLPAAIVVLLGLVVLAAIALPTWLVMRHANTIAHEGAHALVGWGMGGRVQSVTMEGDSSGLTKVTFRPGTGGFLFLLVGYLGPSAFGLAGAKLISIGHIVAVLWLALLLLAALLITVRNFFGFCSVVITGFVLYLFARYGSIGLETVVAYVITWFLLLSGLRVVLLYNGRKGDAPALAKTTHIPSWLWVGVWQLGATAALLLGGKLLI
jgi:hypothetical protein